MDPARRPLMISPRFGELDEVLKRVRAAEQAGVDQIWLEQQPDQRDALVLAGAYLAAAPAVTVGTAVMPVYGRHPVAMAQAAATLAELSGGRFVLGLGYGHQYVNEHVLGCRPAPPITAMTEYVSIVRALVDHGVCEVEGRAFTARSQYGEPQPGVPVYLAALQPQMIRLATRIGDGIILWLCSPRFVRERVTPVVRAACAEAGRDPDGFPVLAIAPAYAGPDVAAQAAGWRRTAMSYRMLPFYRKVLDAFGRPDPAQLALIGTPDEIAERMAEYRAAGAVPVPSPMPGSADDFATTVHAVYRD